MNCADWEERIALYSSGDLALVEVEGFDDRTRVGEAAEGEPHEDEADAGEGEAADDFADRAG